MPKVNCAIVGCSSSTYGINKSKKEPCLEHGHKNVVKEQCPNCERPYSPYCFPAEMTKGKERDAWIQALKRENPNRTKWTPKNSDRTCSLHFVDGIPTMVGKSTANHAYGLRYKKTQNSTPSLFKHPLTAKKIRVEEGEMEIGIINNEVNQIESTTKLSSSVVLDNHSYCWHKDTQKCLACVDQRNLIEVLVNEINELTFENKLLKKKTLCYANSNRSCFARCKIKADAEMNFDTGIQTKEVFSVIFILYKPYLPNIVHWISPAKHRVTSTKKKKHSIIKSSKKLTQREEFLLTLMRLCLGILNEDLADIFCISPALCSRTLTTWIRLLHQLFGNALVVWLPREAIRQNLPNVFRKARYSSCRVILDCAEVFIERSKSLGNQAYTWSDYKHHNTIKFLVDISPNGFITFLLDCCGGRAPGK